ncbi:putative glutamine amidotransferase DUG3 [Fulvia fulva]|uniref:Glutamine amidotransferase DUG3 n=1 Tax=Passalora fulva TaxID=5499 RepID=A0A9Q8LBI9_PASFU|nr:putative glutamine amidotransferase DUG3 [Fulvia fulva]KAK4631817.1 putative glutamine amidotransferase DUG3 [Fulvia fulva]KAK4632588.1 putative glutamine amidotransferase DUG3 [Fulvia fulva]UJO14214.1 putative glutamine amidotransferase DUG3 [Fulvia fulva]WPV11015.1 putative glutamine amidotransferase DUG3 [Fulvia fulva]WPV26631.1 putative glutamine amidotransferase DUG3 [Fulvia fulva]
MCRFLIYSGQSPILLSHLITSPTHSILTQSYDSRLRIDTTRPHNGDGFGVGYYTTAPAPRGRSLSNTHPSHSYAPKEEVVDLGPEPCIFTSTIPAWNCRNLERLASKTVSPLIFAHVRASTEGALSDSNCHPFSRGALMWMHNGGIGGWKLGVKRRLVSEIGDRWFEGIQGSTDSECAFALFLDCLDKAGVDPDDAVKQVDGFGHTVLRKAMLKTIERINGYIKSLPDFRKEEEDNFTSLLNFAVTDGKSVICTRYVSSNKNEAASLFFSSGTNWAEQPSATPNAKSKVGKGEYKMERRDKGADIVLVASEPLTFERDNWVTVPTNSVLTIHNQNVLIHPILDEYYNHTASFVRSTEFAADKGQTTGDGMAEKNSAQGAIARMSSVDGLADRGGGVAVGAAA